jgi:hypothetical protein
MNNKIYELVTIIQQLKSQQFEYNPYPKYFVFPGIATG